MYIKRTLEGVIKKAAMEFPAVALTGPRQSGKTTLLKHIFGKSTRYVSLEPPDIRAAASSDPRGFLDINPAPVIFDEIQYAPELLPYIKERIDANRERKGQYILTGSQNILLAERINESLAGRTAVLRLLPLSYREIARSPQAHLPWEGRIVPKKSLAPYKNLWESFLRGGFPELNAGGRRDLELWHSSYVQTYLERDIRQLRQVGDLSQFQSFLSMLAARSAQLLNLSDISRDLGIAVNTVKAWISILEATYQIVILRPYFGNVGKRLIKSPKIFFSDVGILCYLAGLKDPRHAMASPMSGAIMETAVINEVIRTLTHRGIQPSIYFWRTSTGEEVDLLVQIEDGIVPIEIKASATPNTGMAKGITTFRKVLKGNVLKGYVIHSGDVKLPLGPNAIALPFREL